VSKTKVDSTLAGLTPDGKEVARWTLESPEHGVTVSVLEWGATLQSVRVPDRDGEAAEITLGLPTLQDFFSSAYLARNPFLGATIGRYANRIARGEFELDGFHHQLSRNERGNALHGGALGFAQRLWGSTELPDGVRLSRLSADGEEGFPGNLEVAVEFRLIDAELHVDYQASTDRRTVINLTNHAYWNLAGDAAVGSAMRHVLQVEADSYLPIDDELIPIGTLEPVRHSPFDFRHPRQVGASLNDTHLQLERADGIDHTFVLRPTQRKLRQAMTVCDPTSGRTLSIATTEPGLQVYTGNQLDGSLSGHGGRAYERRSGLAFEPQHFPDSPNNRGFPSTVLAPGRLFRSTTRYTFGAMM
jgi:aldose 1-epimerase